MKDLLKPIDANEAYRLCTFCPFNLVYNSDTFIIENGGIFYLIKNKLNFNKEGIINLNYKEIREEYLNKMTYDGVKKYIHNLKSKNIILHYHKNGYDFKNVKTIVI
jgi:predicted nucleic acid-binding protein